MQENAPVQPGVPEQQSEFLQLHGLLYSVPGALFLVRILPNYTSQVLLLDVDRSSGSPGGSHWSRRLRSLLRFYTDLCTSFLIFILLYWLVVSL